MNMHASEALRARQGEQPRSYELTNTIAAMLEQYGLRGISLENTRIPNILEETVALAEEMSDRRMPLRIETMIQARMSWYEASVAMLEQHQSDLIASILSGKSPDTNASIVTVA